MSTIAGIQVEYVSATDTAKVIRKELKKRWPEAKFSVRTDKYAGGASIRIEYTDGPALEDVERFGNRFEGAGFDGMVDLKYHRYHWRLPDGTYSLALSQGTEYSRGMHPRVENAPPHPDAVPVSFGADFVFVERTFSAGGAREIVATIGTKYGIPEEEWPAVAESEGWGARLEDGHRRPWSNSTDTWHDLFWRTSRKAAASDL